MGDFYTTGNSPEKSILNFFYSFQHFADLKIEKRDLLWKVFFLSNLSAEMVAKVNALKKINLLLDVGAEKMNEAK